MPGRYHIGSRPPLYKNRLGSYARPHGNHTGTGVFLPSNRFQRPHAAGTSGLTSLGLLAPFVLSDLSGGILDGRKPWSVDMLVMESCASGAAARERIGEKGFVVLRSWHRCVFGYGDFVDRICQLC